MAGYILIIEDSAPIRRLVEICLRNLGPTIVTAADGPAGLALANANTPSLIVLDIGLPNKDGWDVLAELRSHPILAGVRVLILTAHADEEGHFHAGTDHADAFMSKPFEPAELVSVASRLLKAGPRPFAPMPARAPSLTRE